MGFWKTSTRQVLLLTLVLGVLLAIVFRSGPTKSPEQLRDDRLLLAAGGNDLEGVQQAIADGADLRAFDENVASTRTALSYAVEHDNLAMVDALLAAGADPEQPFRIGADSITPLQFAVRNNQFAVTERLLAAGAKGSLDKAVTLCMQNNQLEMLDVLFKQFDPAEWAKQLAQNKEMLRHFLERSEPGRRTDAAKESMQAAMDIAVRNRDEALCDLLCEFGAPYMPREAAAFNRLDDVRRMVNADPALLQARCRPYQPGAEPTLLGIALSRGHREVARYLIEAGAPLDAIEGESQTMMHRAAAGGDPELIQLLAARGVAVNALDDLKGAPLSEAVFRNQAEAVAALLELGADPTPAGLLQHVAYSNDAEIARLLLDAGADPAQERGDGKTPLEIAKAQGSVDVIRVLEEHAAEK